MGNGNSRKWASWTRHLYSLLFLTFVAASTHSGRAAESANMPEPLPDVFRPISWEIEVEHIKKLFPDADIQDIEYTGISGERMIATTIFKVKWQYLGAAVVSVVRQRYKREISFIEISTTETRPECFPDNNPRPKWCRTSYNEELMSIFKEAREFLSERHGPPVAYKGVGYHQAAGYPPDPREITLKWERKGFDLFLSITEGEESDWAVGLSAIRRDLPY